MNTTEARKIILKAFDALPMKNRANLRFHGRHGTPVACGIYYLKYVSPKGYG